MPTTEPDDPQARWSAVDEYITGHLVPEDEALIEAARASEAAGLPPIAVTPAQGKLLHLLARVQGARTILDPDADDPSGGNALIRGVRSFYELLAAEPRVDATAVQTVGTQPNDRRVRAALRIDLRGGRDQRPDRADRTRFKASVCCSNNSWKRARRAGCASLRASRGPGAARRRSVTVYVLALSLR